MRVEHVTHVVIRRERLPNPSGQPRGQRSVRLEAAGLEPKARRGVSDGVLRQDTFQRRWCAQKGSDPYLLTGSVLHPAA